MPTNFFLGGKKGCTMNVERAECSSSVDRIDDFWSEISMKMLGKDSCFGQILISPSGNTTTFLFWFSLLVNSKIYIATAILNALVITLARLGFGFVETGPARFLCGFWPANLTTYRIEIRFSL